MPPPRESSTAKMPPPIPWQDCWAKTTADGSPGVDVYTHCLTVGRVAEALLRVLPVGLRDQLPSWSAALAALHDVGKVSPGFQYKCAPVYAALPEPRPDLNALEPMHAKVSETAVNSWLDGDPLDDDHLPAAAILGAHHGDRDQFVLHSSVSLNQLVSSVIALARSRPER